MRLTSFSCMFLFLSLSLSLFFPPSLFLLVADCIYVQSDMLLHTNAVMLSATLYFSFADGRWQRCDMLTTRCQWLNVNRSTEPEREVDMLSHKAETTNHMTLQSHFIKHHRCCEKNYTGLTMAVCPFCSLNFVFISMLLIIKVSLRNFHKRTMFWFFYPCILIQPC